MYHLCALAWLSAIAALGRLAASAPITGDQAMGIVWTFDNETWIENLAIRSNGEILATSINRHALYLVDPFAHTSTIVHQFDATEALLGIAEIDDDVFAVASGNVTLETSLSYPGSSKLWKVDMCGSDQASVKLITALPSVGTPDGVVTLSYGTQAEVLIADSSQGLIWRVNTLTGAASVAIENAALVPGNPMIPIGVDGLHLHDGLLYFSNLGNSSISRVQIEADGAAAGALQKWGELPGVDDFAIANDGTIYAVGFNSLYRLSPSKNMTTLAGGFADVTVEGATSAQMGRTRWDKDVLYIGTSGGMLGAVDGDIHGGQILAINVALFK